MTNNAPGTLTVRNALIFNGTTFAAEEDAIRLASYVYSRDFNRLLRVAEQIEFGMVASTPESSPTPPPRSAGHSTPDWAARSAPNASPNTPPRSTSGSQTPTLISRTVPHGPTDPRTRRSES